ncbi:hypothetical protein FHR32_005088 [Streptosporangium album]|uniref:4Fe-4S Wbl-type domain-containing protein n=1 Tax=Streptosporangium album TaxID=47479 RepID=A0A7W7WB51_9ACTN|nr:WhiB family transcriptional regulator [Streptosporangium album]MBB4940711.1 hypothetical protein [Streptosporangium album]
MNAPYPTTTLPKPCEQDPESWYAPNVTRERARAMCSGCPVLGACAEYGIARERYGVWGGLTERARERARANKGLTLPLHPRPQNQPKDARLARDLELLHDSEELLGRGVGFEAVAQRLGCSRHGLTSARTRARKHLAEAS